MSKLHLVIVASACLAFMASAQSAAASQTTAGNINSVMAGAESSGGQFFFNTTGTRTAAPSCAIQPRWVVDTSTLPGQAVVAALLSAYAMNKQIVVMGTGSCTVWGDTETVSYFYMID
jgi:hypothetical protein